MVQKFLEYRNSNIFPFLLLFFGFAVTLIGANWEWQRELTASQQRFVEDARVRESYFQNSIQKASQTLVSVAGFFAGSNVVDSQEFKIFIETTQTFQQEVISLGYMDIVHDGELSAYKEKVRSENEGLNFVFDVYDPNDEGELIPVTDDGKHLVVRYIWSKEQGGLPPGLDVVDSMGPTFGLPELIEETNIDRQVYISNMLRFIGAGDRERIYSVLFWPVFEDPEAQSGQPVGYVFSTVSYKGLVEEANESFVNKDVEFYIDLKDNEGNVSQNPTIDFAALKISPDGNYEKLASRPIIEDFHYEHILESNGHNIEIMMLPVGEGYAPHFSAPIFILITGFLSTIIISWSAYNITRTKTKIEEQVKIKTEDLIEANTFLADKQNQLIALNKDLKSAMQAAEGASKAKSQFLANMSHELRTPLNAIIGYSEMLQGEAEDLDEMEDMVDDLGKILKSGRHLLNLINDILDLSRIEAERLDLNPEKVYINELIDSVASLVKPVIEKNSNYFSFDCSDKLKTMITDERRLHQILFNLLSNAGKFTKDGTVRFAANALKQDGQEWVVFYVEDTGIGITEEQMENIFDAFSQADASTTRRFGGSGLGLAISQEFSKLLGGFIKVKSIYGEGSRFELRLPLEFFNETESEAEAKAEEEKVGKDLPLDLVDEKNIPLPDFSNPDDVDSLELEIPEGSKTVLIVDDEEQAREISRRFLSGQGYTIIEASNGESGIKMARQYDLDLIVLDIMMPGINGWSVLEILKADTELMDIPVIICSMVDDTSKGFVMGASDFLQKPVEKGQLCKTVNKYISGDFDNPPLVLVIEDEEDLRGLMSKVLVSDGYKVVEAENGSVGLAVIEEVVPELILLDLMMPVMDGFKFLEIFRQMPLYEEVPVIIITAKEMKQSEKMQLNGKVATILRKGTYKQKDLLREVEGLINKPKAIKLTKAE